MRWGLFFLHAFQNSNTHLKKQIQWDGDQNESHQVRWGDDSGHHHDDDQGVFAVAFQEIGFHGSNLAKEESDDGQLENQAHDERQGGEGADVGTQGDVAFHDVGYAVSA